jgi:hypothetical protein
MILNFPYHVRRLLIMTYADFDRKNIICPEVDDYIDLKLGRFP